jgi:hypothetical protein
MALILSLQDDPEMQALLNDPALLEAVQAGDLSALTANPRFMKLLDNAKVKEIQKRVGERPMPRTNKLLGSPLRSSKRSLRRILSYWCATLAFTNGKEASDARNYRGFPQEPN